MTKGIFIWLLLFLIGSSLSSPPMAGGEDNGKEELLDGKIHSLAV